MRKELLLETCCGQTRLALLEDGALCELYVERQTAQKLVGDLYMGRVMNVLPGMQAAFVNIGLEKNGFLYAGDIPGDPSDFGADAAALRAQFEQLSIRKLVKPGQEILVQVVKDPGGSKGPRLTSNITLPGRMAVLLPTVGYVGVSRRIEREEERTRLRALATALKPEGMGLIVRTAAEDADEDALGADIAYLKKRYDALLETARHTPAPKRIHRDLGLALRAVRDMLLPDVESLTLDDPFVYESVRREAALLAPSLADKIRLVSGGRPLFEVNGVSAQAEKALARRVWLKSGGYLVIDHAEAFTAIDVNTGKFVGKSSLSDTVYQTNCEAAEEIARQLRLRDIGGIIVIDFIDMDDQAQRDGLLSLFRKALRRDRTKTNLAGLTSLGLVEMTRKKIHQPIYKQLETPCPHCQGSGRIPSADTVAYQALLSVTRAVQPESSVWLVEAPEPVVQSMLEIGAPEPVKVFARACGSADADARVTQVVEHNLPSGAKRLPTIDWTQRSKS